MISCPNRLHKAFQNVFWLFLIFSFYFTAVAQQIIPNKKLVRPASSNLLSNEASTFPWPATNQNKGGWLHYKDGCYGSSASGFTDLRVNSHSATPDGTGAIRIGTYEKVNPDQWLGDLTNCNIVTTSGRSIRDLMLKNSIPVKPNTFYTFSFKAFTANVRPSNAVNISIKNVNEWAIFRSYSISKSDTWEEIAVVFKTENADSAIELGIAAFPRVDGLQQEIFVDDLYLGEGISYEDDPVSKTAFNGNNVRVDELGNIEVIKNGAWTPFFPVGIYGDNLRIDHDLAAQNGSGTYNDYGFNLAMRTAGGYFQKSIDTGMEWVNIDITSYLFPTHPNYGQFDNLITYVNGIDQTKLFSFHHDNELTREIYAVKAELYALLHTEFPGIPVYALNGTYGNAPRWNKLSGDLANIDITGTYTGFINGIVPPNPTVIYPVSFVMLDHQANQTVPPSFAQLNVPAMPWRSRVYSAIAHGAKGVAYYRDCYVNGSCTEADQLDLDAIPWIADVNIINNEIAQLMPIIRQPHWTSWKVNISNTSIGTVSPIDFGTRELDGNAYLILANLNSDAEETASFEITGGNFNGYQVFDYFSNTLLETISNNTISNISVAAGGSRVLKLESTLTIPDYKNLEGAIKIIYGNDSKKSITVSRSLNAKQIQDFDVYNIHGQLLSNHSFTPSKENYKLNTSHLSSGVYLLDFVNTEGKKIIKKIVIR